MQTLMLYSSLIFLKYFILHFSGHFHFSQGKVSFYYSFILTLNSDLFLRLILDSGLRLFYLTYLFASGVVFLFSTYFDLAP
jgi:hypothetical protein